LALASAVNEAFGAETGQRPGTSVYVETRVRAGRLVLWELAGEMVSTANPTSNALYPRLGYRPVEDKVVLAFGPGEGRQG
jgi:hypothetical protein